MQSHKKKRERKDWLNWKCFTISNLFKLTWLQLWDVENFISFPKSPRSLKSELCPQYKVGIAEKQRQHKGYFTGLSGVPNLLKMICLQLWDVEDFIIFSKSTRSSKSELGAKSYGQNTTSKHGMSIAHRTVRCAMSSAPSSEAPTATFNGQYTWHVRCAAKSCRTAFQRLYLS
jgi:hypothetical protein